MRVSIEDYIWEHMNNTRNRALQALSSVINSNDLEGFSELLLEGYSMGMPFVEKIAQELELGPKEFMALAENFEGYRDAISEKWSEAECDQYAS
jgi:hypothetical protein